MLSFLINLSIFVAYLGAGLPSSNLTYELEVPEELQKILVKN